MRGRVHFAFASVLLLAAVVRADEGIPARRLAELKEAIVYVNVDGAARTGFFFLMDDETALVATVYCKSTSSVSVILRPGTSKEKAVPAEIVASDPDTHLTVLK